MEARLANMRMPLCVRQCTCHDIGIDCVSQRWSYIALKVGAIVAQSEYAQFDGASSSCAVSSDQSLQKALKMAERGGARRTAVEYSHEASETNNGCCLSTINNSLPELGRW